MPDGNPTVSVSAHSAGAYTATLLAMVNVIKGVGVHPPLSPARANFTLMTECTPESSRCNSVYSVGCTLHCYNIQWDNLGPPPPVYMPDIVTAIMTDDCIHLLYNSSWKFLQHAAEHLLSGQPVRYGKWRRHGPSITNKITPAGSISYSQPRRPPCWTSPLAFGLIGYNNPCEESV